MLKWLVLVGVLVRLLPVKVFAADKDYVAWVWPVRGREYWRQGQDLSHLTSLTDLVAVSDLPSTWLLQYDALLDGQIVDRVQGIEGEQEKGLFLEVTRKLALAAQVNYPWESEKWERADKVFLSGFDPADRIKLINTAMAKFKDTFGQYPTSVGAWYIDGKSLVYLRQKYRVEAALGVADQYITDGYQIWGQYIGEPYYPSLGSVLEPALNADDKIDVVKLQWAAREPLLAYGAGGEYSNYSVQANDFGRAKGLGMDYFSRLVQTYTTEVAADLAQVTLGIEVGELEDKYLPLVEEQMQVARGLGLEETTMARFAQMYKSIYPNISPELVVKSTHGGRSISWYQSPRLRYAILEEGGERKLVDLRYYHASAFFENDWNEADKRQNLYRVVPAEVDLVAFGSWAMPEATAAARQPQLATRAGELSGWDKARRWLARFIPDVRGSYIEGKWVVGWAKDAQTLCLVQCQTYPYPYLEAFLNLNKWRQPQFNWYARWQDQLGNRQSVVVKDSPYGIESLAKELVRPKQWENSYYLRY